jgi:hypothetical protein
MNHAWKPEREPTPQELAAYFDGELAGTERAAVEEWLAAHPEGQAEIESLRQLHALYDAQPVPEPSPAAWERTRDRITADVERDRRRRSWSWAMLSGLAAAALVGVLIFRGGAPEDTEPFPVVSPDDVQIISMNPNDNAALVGVRPLLLNQIDLATHAEIEILEGNNDGVMRIDEWATPMIVDPQSVGSAR